MRFAPLLVWAIAACGSGQAERHFRLDAQSGRSLVGAWDAKLSLIQPYPLYMTWISRRSDSIGSTTMCFLRL